MIRGLKKKLDRKTKAELIKSIYSLKANISRLNNRFNRDKVELMYRNRLISLLNRKLDCLEKKIGYKRNFASLGTRHNRDITAMKKRNKKSMQQRK